MCGRTHFQTLLLIKGPLAREFYAEMCRIERWDVQTLRRQSPAIPFKVLTAAANRIQEDCVRYLSRV